MLHFTCFWLPGCGDFALFQTVPWLALSPRLSQNTPSTELFSKKNQVLSSNFFSFSNMFFIRLFLANARKKKSGVTLLVSSQTAVKGGHSFQMAVRIENLRGGDWDETQNDAHCVRSLLSISNLFSVVFMCLISPTLKFTLGKSAKITKNEVSQDLMRFYSYEPLVETIL